MCRLLRIISVVLLVAISPAHAETDVAAIQSKLKELGLYYGQADGSWGDETSAAVTRYQIREGLEINGRLTSETLHSLGLEEGDAIAEGDQPSGSAWKLLREQDAAVLNDLPAPPAAEEPEVTQNVTESSDAATEAPSAIPQPSPVQEEVPAVSEPIPPTAPEPIPPAAPEPPRSNVPFTQDRLQNYIAAYILAGLSPTVDAELEFFADEVDYFDDGNVDRGFIRRDLLRYNAQYPDRRFWLAGAPEIRSETDEVIRVSFPLRFEVSGKSGRKSGKVLKIVELRKAGRQLVITAVDEKHLD